MKGDAATWAAAAALTLTAAGLFALATFGSPPSPAGAEPRAAAVLAVPPPHPAEAPAAAEPPTQLQSAPQQPAQAQPVQPQPAVSTEPYPGEPPPPEEPAPVLPSPTPAPSLAAPSLRDGPPREGTPREGTPLWRANAVAFHAPVGRPMVAVVIDDMGLDRKRSARTVKLPGPLTLSWLPYADDLPAQTAAAKAAGHELMLHLPMEPSIPVNPGPDALLTSLSADENLRRLDRALGRFSGFVGVNNHMGSRFTADRAALRPIIAEINRRGYLWYDSRTAPASVGMALAAEIGAPWAGRDVFLDHVMTAGEVAKALARLEALAKQRGVSTAIGHPHDVTIDALARWLPELPKRGLTLVPLSAVVAAKHSSSHTRKNGDVK